MFRLAPAAGLLVALLAPLAAGPAGAGQEPDQLPEIRFSDWEEAWVSDLPSVDLAGTWVFTPEGSDPMLADWQGSEVRYIIAQGPDNVILDFEVEGGHSNRQAYRWDGTVHRFERGGREVAERARWTEAGRVLEIQGRHWSPLRPDEVTRYAFRYTVRGGVLTFQQTDENGTTTWRFTRRSWER